MKKSTIIIWAEIALVFIVVAAVYVHLSGHSKVSSVDDDYPYSPEWTVVEKIDKPFTNIHIAYSSGHLQKHGSDYTSANYKIIVWRTSMLCLPTPFLSLTTNCLPSRSGKP